MQNSLSDIGIMFMNILGNGLQIYLTIMGNWNIIISILDGEAKSVCRQANAKIMKLKNVDKKRTWKYRNEKFSALRRELEALWNFPNMRINFIRKLKN